MLRVRAEFYARARADSPFVESALLFGVPHFLTVNRIHFTEKCSRVPLRRSGAMSRPCRRTRLQFQGSSTLPAFRCLIRKLMKAFTLVGTKRRWGWSA